MSEKIYTPPKDENEAYQRLIEAIENNIGYPLTELQKHEAARNLITFYKTALEIHRHIRESMPHDKPDRTPET